MMSMTSGTVYIFLPAPVMDSEPAGLLGAMTSLPVISASHLKTSLHGLPSIVKAIFRSGGSSFLGSAAFAAAAAGGAATRVETYSGSAQYTPLAPPNSIASPAQRETR